MFVGEAPGRDEDIEGLPFVGRSGKLLDRMIGAIGLDRAKVYIANVIPWRPPGNRTPTPQETQICLPFIRRQIELVDPDVLVTLGNPSTQALLGTSEGIMRTRGKWRDYDTGKRTIRAIATFHPAYLLRSPSYKRLSWQDLRAIAKVLAVRRSEFHVIARSDSDEAIQSRVHDSGLLRCARNDVTCVATAGLSAGRWPSRCAAAVAGR